jgi:rhodanese-related sulfurtransferase
VLEWRVAPSSAHRDPSIARVDTHIVLICNEGFQSSLAAATLQRLGLPLATDVIGGFQAWLAHLSDGAGVSSATIWSGS